MTPVFLRVPGRRRLDNISEILLVKYCSVCKRQKAYIRDRARGYAPRSWISSYRSSVAIFLVRCTRVHHRMHVCMYACMRGCFRCIRPYRIDIHERTADCRHDAIKRITILHGATMLNAPGTTLHYS